VIILTSNLGRFGVFRIYISKSDSSIWIKSIGAWAASRFGARHGDMASKRYLSELESVLNQIKRK